METKLQDWREKFAKLPKKLFGASVRKIFFLISLSILNLIFLIFISYHLAYWDRIYPGLSVAGQSVGNLTLSQATLAIGRRLSEISSNKVLLVHDSQQWELDLGELEFSYESAEAAQKAYRVGRSGNLTKDLVTKIKSWREGIKLEIEYSLNQDLLETKIATIASQIYVPTTEASIKLTNHEIEVEPGKEGREIDRQKLTATINYQLARPLEFFQTATTEPVSLPVSIEIPLVNRPPTLTFKQIEKTRRRAKKFLGKKLILVNEAMEWQLEEEELIQLLSFTDGFDQRKIASWSANLATAINRPSENAAFQFEEGQVVEFRPAREGKALGQRKAIELVTNGLTELEALQIDGQKETEVTINLPVIITQPEIKTADVNTLGIKELISQGTSYFRGSITSRIHNIQLASSKLNGLLIPPGETFSFNQSIGEISKATGYKEAYIIKQGRTILGDGGGVCQVSTTLFRTALKAGLPIIERRHHAYRVSYYEQDSPPGIDATVFSPTADLKFKNDTPAYILIQSRVDLINKKLVFEFYGTHDGRTANISKSRIWDQVPPPPDLYQDDPTLPEGTVKQIDWKAWGAKVAFDYRVERNGEVLQERTFYSAYRPWQTVFLRGTAPAGQ